MVKEIYKADHKINASMYEYSQYKRLRYVRCADD